ncbi:hypothetical protein [Glaciibacter psychrotolerans]|uniref:Uncharacterized protein n=1 Tax=Glaciibacter psychrotolerans TaxID=670054 RepID=A0A7Z0J671_9MICO|nr:hypothetical protein [Leifsonia psychrotolerans]NYJ19613.1 hypothetical protein [Leifsonia psychrotolerans]
MAEELISNLEFATKVGQTMCRSKADGGARCTGSCTDSAVERRREAARARYAAAKGAPVRKYGVNPPRKRNPKASPAKHSAFLAGDALDVIAAAVAELLALQKTGAPIRMADLDEQVRDAFMSELEATEP